MKKSILLPFLLPIIGFAAVKGYFWYQVKTVVDDAIAKIGPFAVVEYQGIETSFDGAAGVSGLKITPMGLGETLEVAALRVTAPSWTYFLEAGERINNGEIPEQLGLEIEGFVVDLNSPFFSQLDSEMMTEDALLGCEKANISGMTFMKALGYGQLVTNMKLSYSFDPVSEFLNYNLDMSVDGDSRFSTQADIDLGISALTQANLPQAKPRFGGLEIYYQDLQFNNRRNAYCAKINEEPVLAFVNRHSALLAQRYRDLGFSFSEATEVGYRQFASGNGEMKINLVAANPIGFETLAMYSPNNFFEALDIKLEVNGKQVEPLALAWQAPVNASQNEEELVENDQQVLMEEVQEAVAEAQAQFDLQAPADEEPTAETEAEKADRLSKLEEFNATAFKPVKPAKPSYKVVAFNQLSRHIGAKIRLETQNGHEIEGELMSVSGNQLRLVQRVGNGEAILPISFRRLLEARVLF